MADDLTPERVWQEDGGMRWRVVVWAGVGVAAVAAVGLGMFWKIKGLEEAGWLAGVLSGFAALVSLAIFLYDRLPSRSGPQPSESEPEPAGGPAWAGTVNTFEDATNVGPVVMGRDIRGPVTSGSPPPPAPTREAGRLPAAESTPGAGGEGSVSNTFSGGFNQGPVVMGRDISGPVTSMPSAFPAQAGDRQQQEHIRPGSAEGEHGAERPGSAEAPSGGRGR
ncbi:hypothetical protein [Actinomadura bangladeshensis]|uniref:Uncharacterized protein n=1 Tax=Actinomadura bangladeshensis TaxID=453573 RepID=A0A6L9QQ26_9ACTN|nr:hypothetical protein [Actinomadura bangladeshensis]NEA27537.1 hypothetical protein [Actinomadura bangladeshensis]